MLILSCTLTSIGVAFWAIAAYTAPLHLPSPPRRSWILLAIGMVGILAGLVCACFITPA